MDLVYISRKLAFFSVCKNGHRWGGGTCAHNPAVIYNVLADCPFLVEASVAVWGIYPVLQWVSTVACPEWMFVYRNDIPRPLGPWDTYIQHDAGRSVLCSIYYNTCCQFFKLV